uniref:ABC transporter permease n=1 Tax=Rhodococcoides yunnanense TaxID=278209 RepID=UPI001C3F7215
KPLPQDPPRQSPSPQDPATQEPQPQDPPRQSPPPQDPSRQDQSRVIRLAQEPPLQDRSAQNPSTQDPPPEDLLRQDQSRMIWSAWRQNRTVLLVSLTLVAILIAATLIAGVYVPRYPQLQFSFWRSCSRWNDVGPCRPETALTLSTLFALLLPLLFGMFVGVRVVSRELDTGTFRWYLARIAVVFLPISAVMTCLGLALFWASGRSRHSTDLNGDPAVSFSRFDFPHFETAGITLGAYTLLALLVGSALAIGFRSGGLAMLGTLFVFLLVPVAFTWIARENYGTPALRIEAIDAMSRESEYPPNPYFTTDGTWVVGAGYADKEGEFVDPDTRRCRQEYPENYWAPIPGESTEQRSARMRLDDAARADEYDTCLQGQGVDRFDVRYYTEDRFWRFQAIETGSMLVFASCAAAFGAWRLRRLG